MSRPALASTLLSPTIAPPTLLISVRAFSLTSAACSVPDWLVMLSASTCSTLRPARVPWLNRSPLSLIETLFPAISAPEPSISPGFTLAYTCGTSTFSMVPSGIFTRVLTSQTMSPVSSAICAGVSATPIFSAYCLPKVMP
ncbi:hypothetical protein D3C75_1119660 [compost metagenome]